MGSCLSKRSETPTVRRSSAEERDLVPEPEEKVKEVLSETPARKVHTAAGAATFSHCEERSEEVSSDLCSLSETLSVSTTTTTTEKKYQPERKPRVREEPTAARYLMNRSYSGELPLRKNRSSVDVGCGGVRSSPSPVRRKESAVGRTYSARESRIHAPPAASGLRRDPADERSGRMAVKRPVAEQRGRSMSAPRTFRNGKASPRRMRTPVMDARLSGGAAEGNGLLENPLVSLECFIFL